MDLPPLVRRLPADPTPDALLDAFIDFATEKGLELYPAQEEALLSIFAGHHVVLNTPTGSGKSLVALALHFRALAKKERSFYTAPIKALVSEKFFDLCRDLGAENVGMMTGDATVNRDALVVCCTAEILGNMALRDGEESDVLHVVMDEFHYYGDRDRGVAWQVPLLTMPQTTFLLMSATLGGTENFISALEQLGDRPADLVRSTERPVPLDFEYRLTPLHETIDDLLSSERSPIYIVHFTQRSATEQAQNLLSIDFLDKEAKRAIKTELAGFRFDTPFGKELKRFVLHGVGVHHAGMLPKYRRVVERLAQAGHMKIICGTDTLGVGVNIPIRTVLFTQLCKFDGEKTGVLTVRDFQQIAGRAGRRGYDTRGSVVAQAPEHVIENRNAESKVAGDAKKLRKLKRKKPPERGYAHFDEAVFERLQTSDPEELRSSFSVTHAMLLHTLGRPTDGCVALKSLIRASHESPVMKRRHGRRAIALYRSLVEQGVVEVLPSPLPSGAKVEVSIDLQEDFSLNQALGLWVVDTIGELDKEDPEYALNVMTLVESILENPRVVLMRQTDKLKTDAVNEMKAEGVEYDDRMKILDEIEYPKPHKEFIYATYNAYKESRPWLDGSGRDENIRPKSIARDMYERAEGFRDYVKTMGLARSEGVLLRYLSSAYRTLLQTVPDHAKTDEVDELSEWLKAVVRQVDSSLIDEWDKLRNPEELTPEAEPKPKKEYDITEDRRAFTVLIRNKVFRFVTFLARGQLEAAIEVLAGSNYSPDEIETAFRPFIEEYKEVCVDPSARAPARTRIDFKGRTCDQVIVDPEGHLEWFARFEIDWEASREEKGPMLSLSYLGNDPSAPAKV